MTRLLEPKTKTGRWLADQIDPDDLPEGWDDPYALIALIEQEAIADAAEGGGE